MLPHIPVSAVFFNFNDEERKEKTKDDQTTTRQNVKSINKKIMNKEQCGSFSADLWYSGLCVCWSVSCDCMNLYLYTFTYGCFWGAMLCVVCVFMLVWLCICCLCVSEHSEHYIRCKARRMWTRRSVGLWPDAKWLGLEEEKNKTNFS